MRRTLHPPKKGGASGKTKRTFSLSRDSIRYLEEARREKASNSMSAILEDVIRQQREAAEAARISASITRYYDSLTDEEVAEDRAWGEFALTQFPPEE